MQVNDAGAETADGGLVEPLDAFSQPAITSSGAAQSKRPRHRDGAFSGLRYRSKGPSRLGPNRLEGDEGRQAGNGTCARITMIMTWLDHLPQPVISAPMAGASGGRLAAAVSAAGGLGMIGFGATADPATVARESAVARRDGAGNASGDLERGGRVPGALFGIGLMLWALEGRPGLLEASIEQRPALISLSFGDPRPFVPRVRDAGVPVCTQVGTLEEARRALDAGVDLLVARGSEGGGHGRGEVATLPLLQQVLEVSPVPVAAAGGIGTARGLAAVLAAGASAAWIGTPFAACAESELAEPLKEAVLAGDAADTVYTRAFDVAQRLSWPEVYGARALANDFTRQWAGRVPELERVVADDDEVTVRMAAARSSGDVTTAPVYAGQSAGLVDRHRTAAEVMADLSGFRTHLDAARRWSAHLSRVTR